MSFQGRVIAFYLPQFHPIPENDGWWGKGFTEWTNVAKARPLFSDHYQPHLPADLGFYDLRLPEARQAQAELAQEYGLDGFCYYHYWFNGRRLLGRPFEEVLASSEPTLPFCLCWANENWTRRWDGQDDEVLIRQQYTEDDDRQHIRWLLTALRDERYIRVAGRPLLLVYRTTRLPDPGRTAAMWREEAWKSGVGELLLCRVESFADERGDPKRIGFDAAVEFQPDWCDYDPPRRLRGNLVYEYGSLAKRIPRRPWPRYKRFPCVMPSWDNSPRRKAGATIFRGSTPVLYEEWLRGVLRGTAWVPTEQNLVFINAWNEWGEGNHLEPCLKWGRSYLEATRRARDLEVTNAGGADAGEVTLTGAPASIYTEMISAARADAAALLRHARGECLRVAVDLEEAQEELARLHRLRETAERLAALVPPGAAFILVDDQEIGSEPIPGRRAIPFLERDGQYWGPPPDDETAVRELERLKREGAELIVFAWPAFWWLDHYAGLARHLRSKYRSIREDDVLIAFDLDRGTDK